MVQHHDENDYGNTFPVEDDYDNLFLLEVSRIAVLEQRLSLWRYLEARESRFANRSLRAAA
jgi:hypothetical protein